MERGFEGVKALLSCRGAADIVGICLALIITWRDLHGLISCGNACPLQMASSEILTAASKVFCGLLTMQRVARSSRLLLRVPTSTEPCVCSGAPHSGKTYGAYSTATVKKSKIDIGRKSSHIGTATVRRN